jgi:hypothetical protein
VVPRQQQHHHVQQQQQQQHSRLVRASEAFQVLGACLFAVVAARAVSAAHAAWQLTVSACALNAPTRAWTHLRATLPSCCPRRHALLSWMTWRCAVCDVCVCVCDVTLTCHTNTRHTEHQ